MTGFGVAWASMMGVPYMLVVGSIPKERFGVYMGIINMMIVIPMIIQTLSFGMIYKTFLGSNPGTAIMMAGVLLLLAAAAVLRMRVVKSEDTPEMMPAGGH
jgi:maltose/moltooligosaccharide transporter